MATPSAVRSESTKTTFMFGSPVDLLKGIFAVLVLSFSLAATHAQDASEATAPEGPPDAPVASPPIPATQAEKTRKHSDKRDKYDVERIGQRKIGKGVNLFSLEKERQLGQRLAAQVERHTKFVSDPLVTDYVNRLGQKLVRNSDAQVPFTIKVIDSQEINTFALPGGFLYVDSGLILAADSEAELAGLMAHEIAHVAARHATRAQTRRQMWDAASMLLYLGGPAGAAVQQLAGIGVPLWFMKLNRDAESEADLLAIEYEYAAGYDPLAFVEFLEKLHVLEERMNHRLFKTRSNRLIRAFASHPITADRIRRAQTEISTLFPARNEYMLDTGDFQEAKARLGHLENVYGTSADGRPTLRRHGSGAGDSSKEKDKGPILRRPSRDLLGLNASAKAIVSRDGTQQ